MKPRRTPLARHVELEKLFGTDFLPLARRGRAKLHPAVAQKETQETGMERRRTVIKPAVPEVLPPEFEKFRTEVLACRKCDSLCDTRTQVVFGVGTIKAPVVFVGEAPGADEDLKGEPFIGRAGQLLTQSLAKLGVAREQVYIANILKCRPPDNRTPRPEEMAACLPYLLKQLDWIKPGRICALGNIAVQSLLGTTLGISKLRGRYHDFHGRPLFATFHPAYILRNMGQLPTFDADIRAVCKDAGLILDS
jgi:uracil-DNA glycosylase family 4